MKLSPYKGKDVILEDLTEGRAQEPYSEILEPTTETFRKLFSKIPQIEKELKTVGVDEKLEIIESVGKLWGNPNYERRKRLQDILPKSTGYHPRMIEFEISYIPQIFNKAEFTNAFNNPYCFGDKKILDEFVKVGKNEYLKAEPLGSTFVIGAGNATIPTLVPLSLSLLTNNFTIIKPSIANYAGLYEVMESFEDLGKTVGPEKRESIRKMTNATLIAYMGHDSEAYDYLLEQAKVGAINFWGGGQALSKIKEKVARNPYNPRFVLNGPMTGYVVMDDEYVAEVDKDEIARELTYQVSLYDQKLCNSPTEGCYIGQYENAKIFAEKHLSHALDEVSKSLPGQVSENQAYKTQVIRKALKREGARVLIPEDGVADWTLVVSDKESHIDKVVNDNFSFQIYERPRFLELISVDTQEDSVKKIKELPNRSCYKGVERIQTVGYAMRPEKAKDFVKKLSDVGVYRTVPLEKMFYRSMLEPSDGVYLPREFIFFTYFSDK